METYTFIYDVTDDGDAFAVIVAGPSESVARATADDWRTEHDSEDIAEAYGVLTMRGDCGAYLIDVPTYRIGSQVQPVR